MVGELELAAGTRCCAPFCRQQTTGAGIDGKVTRIGEAAHITAANPRGPRYDAALSAEERSASMNGIWMCNDHARLIDVDNPRYPTPLLREWKRIGEAAPLASAHGDVSLSLPNFERSVELVSEEAVPELVAEWSYDIGLAKTWGRRLTEATEALVAEVLLNHMCHTGGTRVAILRSQGSTVEASVDGRRFGPESLRAGNRAGGGAAVLKLVEHTLSSVLEVSHSYRNSVNSWRISRDGWPDDGCTWEVKTKLTGDDALERLASCAFIRLRVGKVTLMMSNPLRFLARLADAGISQVVVVDVDRSHFLAESNT